MKTQYLARGMADVDPFPTLGHPSSARHARTDAFPTLGTTNGFDDDEYSSATSDDDSKEAFPTVSAPPRRDRAELDTKSARQDRRSPGGAGGWPSTRRNGGGVGEAPTVNKVLSKRMSVSMVMSTQQKVKGRLLTAKSIIFGRKLGPSGGALAASFPPR